MVHMTQNLHVDGDVTTNGSIKSDGDQVAGPISQIGHVHGGVESGPNKTAGPE